MSKKDALRAITRARTVLLISNPFYGSLSLQLEPVELKSQDKISCRTMAVDGKHLFYWPPFVLSIKEDELVGVVAHEVTHCAYQHMTRRGNRDPRRWNRAADYIVNDDIKAAGFVLPSGHLYDAKYHGMSTEEVYERLPPETPQSGGDGGQAQQGQGDLDPGGCGSVIDAAKPYDKAGQAQMAATWEGNVRMAANVAMANNAGKLPGYLERLVSQLKKPRVSWRTLTRNFIDNSTTKDFSWARPNRRTVGTGVLLPGYVSDRLNHLVMVADTSGSISQEVLNVFVSEVAGALDEGSTDKLTVIYADDGVRHVDEFNSGDLVQAGNIKSLGGGGTDFTGSFKWIKDHAPDASCVIYLTDLMTSGFGEDPQCPTLWGAYLPDSAYAQYAEKVPFGICVQIDTVGA